MTIILYSFYCEAREFNEGQCDDQCALCRQEDADEEQMIADGEDAPIGGRS